MRKSLTILVALLLATVLSTCGKATDVLGDLAKDVAKVLQDLPEVALTLPKSLRAGTSNKSLAYSTTRTITELDSTNVSGIKSQAWMDLQERDDSQLYLNRAIQHIASWAVANDIPVDEVFSVPVSSADLAGIFKIPAGSLAGMSVSNKCVIKGEDASNFLLYINANVSHGVGTINIKVKANIISEVDGSTTMKINLDISMGSGMNQLMYVEYSSKNGDSLSVVLMPSVGTPMAMIQESIVVGTEVTTINRFTGGTGMSESTHVAYGNDIYGGIASLFSMTMPTNPPSTMDFYWGEYYNASGELIRRDNGSTSLWAPDAQITQHQKNIKTLEPGLSALPDKIYTREKYDSVQDKTVYEYKIDDGSWKSLADYGSTTDPNIYWFGFYFKTDTAPSGPWAPRDGVYFMEKNEAIEQPNEWLGMTTWYLGYEVPSSQNLFDKSLYITKEYPLDKLLPISNAFSGYKLIQNELSSNEWTWTDWEGNSKTETYYFYKFYLNNGNVVGNSPDTFDLGFGDIEFNDNNLSQTDVYYFNNGNLTKVKGYFFRTTGDVPPYFTPPVEDAVAQVTSGMQAALEEARTRSVEDYTNMAVSLVGDAVFNSLAL